MWTWVWVLGRSARGKRMLIVVAACGLLSSPALASSWTTGLATGSSGEAAAGPPPTAPTGVSSSCVSPLQANVTVSWAAVTHASSYTVYDSTTSQSTGYSVIAAGVTSTSWTSGTLANGTYWFEVVAVVGNNWTSPNSLPTASRTILLVTCN